MTARLAWLALAPLLCACAQDPAQAGFFGGIGNIVTGTYERREAELRQEQARLLRERETERGRRDLTRAELEAVLRQRTQARERLAALDRRLAQCRAGGQVDPVELDRLEGEVRRIAFENDALGTAPQSEGAVERARQVERDTRAAEARLLALVGPAIRR